MPINSKYQTALDSDKSVNIIVMIFVQFAVTGVLVVLLNLMEINAHGMVMEPVNRGSAFRKGFDTPPNWDDSGNYCGGFAVQNIDNNGECGVCGDNYADEQPRANENGGIYGTGTIVQTYISGQEFKAQVNVTVNHMGQFDFAVCPLSKPNDIETEECFAKYPVKLADGRDKFQLPPGKPDTFYINLVLPKGLTCEHCSFRWNWRVANSWGICGDDTEGLGCGSQETFRTCSDIKIISA